MFGTRALARSITKALPTGENSENWQHRKEIPSRNRCAVVESLKRAVFACREKRPYKAFIKLRWQGCTSGRIGLRDESVRLLYCFKVKLHQFLWVVHICCREIVSLVWGNNFVKFSRFEVQARPVIPYSLLWVWFRIKSHLACFFKLPTLPDSFLEVQTAFDSCSCKQTKGIFIYDVKYNKVLRKNIHGQDFQNPVFSAKSLAGINFRRVILFDQSYTAQAALPSYAREPGKQFFWGSQLKIGRVSFCGLIQRLCFINEGAKN